MNSPTDLSASSESSSSSPAATSSAPHAAAENQLEWVELCGLDDLISAPGKKLCIEKNERVLVVIYNSFKRKVHVLDGHCYHAGGPLWLGDIESLADDLQVVQCPWHRYLLELDTGGGFYIDLQRKLAKKPGGPKQRVHRSYVTEKDAQGGRGRVMAEIPVAGVALTPYLPSDDYCPSQANSRAGITHVVYPS